MTKNYVIFLFVFLFPLTLSAAWTKKQQITTLGNSIEVKIINKELIYVSSSKGILYTKNAGDTWGKMIIPDSVGYIYSFFASNSNKLWFSASKGIYYSINAGSTWELMNKTYYSTIHFVNDSLGFGGGFSIADGTHPIYKTTDKGKTWSTVAKLPNVSEIKRICFIDDNKGFAIVNYLSSPSKGYILQTSNSGVNWLYANFPTTANNNKGYYSDFNSLFICDANTIYVGGYQLIKSEDSGKNWVEVYETINSKLYSIAVSDLHFFDKSNGFFSSQSQSPQSLYKISDNVFSKNNAVIADLQGSIHFDINLANNIGLAISDNGYCWVDQAIQFSPNSVDNPQIDSNISIYPNPANDFIRVSDSTLKLELFNSNGQLIKSVNTITSRQINTETLLAGLYIAKLYTNSGFVIEKLIINRK